MNINNLTEEQRTALLECKSKEEMRAYCKQEGIAIPEELPDELLKEVTGGNTIVSDSTHVNCSAIFK